MEHDEHENPSFQVMSLIFHFDCCCFLGEGGGEMDLSFHKTNKSVFY